MGVVTCRRGITGLATGLAALLAAAGCAAGEAKQPELTTGKGAASPGRAVSAPWDRPTNQDALVRAARLVLFPGEHVDVHYHAHLDVLVDGEPVPVPAGLGINVGPNGTLPDHGAPGIAALHTHDTSGVLHIESPRSDTFTLGQVFRLWDVRLGRGTVGSYRDKEDDTRVAVYVDGKKTSGNPANLVLEDHQEVAVVVATDGTAISADGVPATYDFPDGL